MDLKLLKKTDTIASNLENKIGLKNNHHYNLMGVASWKQYCGNFVLGRHGEIFQKSYVHGKQRITALTDEHLKGCGKVFFELRGEVDTVWIFTDGSYLRAHQHANGARHGEERAIGLSRGGAATHFIADKGYDSEAIREQARDAGMNPVIPRKSNSKKPNPEFDSYLYKLRHLVENLFARLKHFKSIATRFEKLARNFKSMLFLACSFIWLKLR